MSQPKNLRPSQLGIQNLGNRKRLLPADVTSVWLEHANANPEPRTMFSVAGDTEPYG